VNGAGLILCYLTGTIMHKALGPLLEKRELEEKKRPMLRIDLLLLVVLWKMQVLFIKGVFEAMIISL